MGQFWINEVCQNDWFEVSEIKNITQELKQSIQSEWLILEDQCLQNAR